MNRTFINYWLPCKDFSDYCVATLQLLESIQEVTNSNYIIDSSKSPVRLLILSKISNLHFIHLMRNFKGVLNSAKKYYAKDILNGIEVEIFPRNSFKVLFDWVLNNFLCEMLAPRRNSIKLKYFNINKVDEKVTKIGVTLNLTNPKSVNKSHLIAGNAIRLKGKISFDPIIGSVYNRLNKRQYYTARFIDNLFWFWS